jgi:hypothetical protein
MEEDEVCPQASASPPAVFSIHRDIERKGGEVPYRIDPIDEYAVWQFKESDGKTAGECIAACPPLLSSRH